jgi:hypothetical protein
MEANIPAIADKNRATAEVGLLAGLLIAADFIEINQRSLLNIVVYI